MLLGTVFTHGCTHRPGPTDKANRRDTSTDTADNQADAFAMVAFDRWTILGSDQDPTPEHQSPEYSCDPGGVLPEEDVLEINTNDCGYAVVGQPSLLPVGSGDTLELLMYDSALSAIDEPAEGHFSLWIGDSLLWELNVAIPAAAEIYQESISVDFDADAGTKIRVHLHNHGGNSWRVAYLRRAP